MQLHQDCKQTLSQCQGVYIILRGLENQQQVYIIKWGELEKK